MVGESRGLLESIGWFVFLCESCFPNLGAHQGTEMVQVTRVLQTIGGLGYWGIQLASLLAE